MNSNRKAADDWCQETGGLLGAETHRSTETNVNSRTITEQPAAHFSKQIADDVEKKKYAVRALERRYKTCMKKEGRAVKSSSSASDEKESWRTRIRHKDETDVTR